MLAMVENPEGLYTATDLAKSTHVRLPTVSKILKLLTKGGLLTSQRGSQGGYQLAMPAHEISLAKIVSVLDGEIAMTDCEKNMGCCEIEADCQVKSNWSVVSHVIEDVLKNISLQQMFEPLVAKDIPVTFYKRAQQ